MPRSYCRTASGQCRPSPRRRPGRGAVLAQLPRVHRSLTRTVNALWRAVAALGRASAAANARGLGARGESLGALRIREATERDVPALARLHVTTWNATYSPLLARGPSVEVRERQWRRKFAER